eukprot:2301838-Pyramimonas_sp.AAC.1
MYLVKSNRSSGLCPSPRWDRSSRICSTPWRRSAVARRRSQPRSTPESWWGSCRRRALHTWNGWAPRSPN